MELEHQRYSRLTPCISTKGVKAVLAAGMGLKINSVLIPGINDRLMVSPAQKSKDLGVRLMDILPQFWWCKQRSADIVHFPPEGHSKKSCL